MTTKKSILSKDFQVLLQVYEDIFVKNEKTYRNKLAQETGFSELEVDKSLDKMYDRLMIDYKIMKVENEQRMCVVIENDFLPFTRGLYNATEQFDFFVLCQIYEDTINNNPSYFSELKEKTGLSKKELSLNLDKLSDMGIIFYNFKKIENKNILCYEIEDDAMEFSKQQYLNLTKKIDTLTKSLDTSDRLSASTEIVDTIKQKHIKTDELKL